MQQLVAQWMIARMEGVMRVIFDRQRPPASVKFKGVSRCPQGYSEC